MAGIIKKDRRLLGWYSLLMWPCFALLCAIGYLAYKQDTWNLKSKLGMQWRYSLNNNDRIAIQNNVSLISYIEIFTHMCVLFKVYATNYVFLPLYQSFVAVGSKIRPIMPLTLPVASLNHYYQAASINYTCLKARSSKPHMLSPFQSSHCSWPL
jgi:hypothetical protein